VVIEETHHEVTRPASRFTNDISSPSQCDTNSPPQAVRIAPGVVVLFELSKV